MGKSNQISFKGQKIFIGIDVHLKNWHITICSQNAILKSFNMPPYAEGLYSFLSSNYPDGEYYSVYEAGFCGYSIHYNLESLGIHNIVVNPGDVPTTNAEKLRKTDAIDSAKLAKSLREGSIKSIYIPNVTNVELRSLIRMKDMITKESTRTKCRIKSFLRYMGIDIPPQFLGFACWSHRFINWLENVSTNTDYGKLTLDMYIEQYKYIRLQRLNLLKSVRRIIKENSKIQSQIELLRSVPGLGELTSLALVSEIIDINRFENTYKLACFIGLVPMCHRSSIDDNSTGEITLRTHMNLRWQLIEVSWRAIKEDPVLTLYFENCCKSMPKNKAIIKVARKLSNRIYHVLKFQTKYECSTNETKLTRKSD